MYLVYALRRALIMRFSAVPTVSDGFIKKGGQGWHAQTIRLKQSLNSEELQSMALLETVLLSYAGSKNLPTSNSSIVTATDPPITTTAEALATIRPENRSPNPLRKRGFYFFTMLQSLI
jgi:hypothetical protein